MKKITLSISLFVLLMSCSMEKRHYRSGFYVEHKQKEEVSRENISGNDLRNSVEALPVKKNSVPFEKQEETLKSIQQKTKTPIAVFPLANKKTLPDTGSSQHEVKKTEAKHFLKTGDDGPRVNINFREVLFIYLLGLVFGILSICILFTIGLDAAAGSLGMIFVVITSVVASVFMLAALLATLLLITLFVIRKIKAHKKTKETGNTN